MSYEETEKEYQDRQRRLVDPNYKLGNTDRNKRKRDRKKAKKKR